MGDQTVTISRISDKPAKSSGLRVCGRDGDFPGQVGRVDQVQVDDHGRVDEPASMAWVSHAVSDPD